MFATIVIIIIINILIIVLLILITIVIVNIFWCRAWLAAQYGRICPEGGPAPPAAAFTAVQHLLARLVQRHIKMVQHIQKFKVSGGGKRPLSREVSAAITNEERAAAQIRHLLGEALLLPLALKMYT